MGRHGAPHWYESRQGWYVRIGDKQILLAKGRKRKKEAHEAFRRLMAEGADPARRAELSVLEMVDLFFGWAESRVSPATAEGYRRRLQAFVDAYGLSRAADIRPLHVARWLESHPAWNDSTRFGYVTAVKRAYSWATRQGHLDVNPVASMERPTMGRRTAVLSAEQVRAIVDHVKNPHFRDLLIALWQTGCRPGEVATLTADRVDLASGTWRVLNKTRHKTGDETRVVGLSDRMVELTRRLLAERKGGLLFVNARGNPWTRNAMACAFAQVRADLGYGPEVTAYAFRHRFGTDGLLKGVPVATVATMMGHRSTAMIMRNYSHLADHPEHLREAIRAIRPDASPAPGSTEAGSPPTPEPAPPPASPRPRRSRGKPPGPPA